MTHPPHSTESQGPPTGLDVDVPIMIDIPVGCGRERVAAMMEAVIGRSLLGPCHPRAWRQERARRVAEIRAVLGATKRQRKPRKPTPDYLAALASKPGIARVEMKPDGTVIVITGEGEQQQGNELDEWIAKHARAT